MADYTADFEIEEREGSGETAGVALHQTADGGIRFEGPTMTPVHEIRLDGEEMDLICVTGAENVPLVGKMREDGSLVPIRDIRRYSHVLYRELLALAKRLGGFKDDSGKPALSEPSNAE